MSAFVEDCWRKREYSSHSITIFDLALHSHGFPFLECKFPMMACLRKRGTADKAWHFLQYKHCKENVACSNRENCAGTIVNKL